MTNRIRTADMEQRKERIRQLVREGFTDNEIAAELSMIEGIPISRNVVIGARHRMQLAGNMKERPNGEPRARPVRKARFNGGEKSTGSPSPPPVTVARPPVQPPPEPRKPGSLWKGQKVKYSEKWLSITPRLREQKEAKRGTVSSTRTRPDGRETVVVIWDGTTSRSSFHVSFIEDAGEPPLAKLSGLYHPVLDLTPFTCRWPVGDPHQADFRYCLAPKEFEASYCSEHVALSYQPRSHRRAA